VNESTVSIIIAVIAAIGSGGLGAAIFHYLEHRKKTEAEAISILSDVYEQRLSTLTDRATALECKVERLEHTIDTLRHEVEERDDMVNLLQKENEALKAEIAKLKTENECKERKILALQKQVKELTARIDAMNGEGDGQSD